MWVFVCQVQNKYVNKSRSDNPPHIYAVADGAYQDAFHHNEAQHVIISGESASGKTSNMLHVLKHMLHLGIVTSVSRTVIKIIIQKLFVKLNTEK